VQQKVGILDALGDALVGEQFADVVAIQKFRKLFGGDVGVDRHVVSRFRSSLAPCGPSDANFGIKGTLQMIFDSSAAYGFEVPITLAANSEEL
jgi:hypothetical protein